MQSKRDSLMEVITNTAAGMAGSFVITYAIYRLELPALVGSVSTVVACTLWSVARGFYIRRRFNARAVTAHQASQAPSKAWIEEKNGDISPR